MTSSRPLSLITGASSGIGAAFARQLAPLNHDLVLTARRADRLETLAAELRGQHGTKVTVLPHDLANPAAPQELADTLNQHGLQVDWLINNAGYGLPGTFDANDWAAHADFLQVLLTAPTELAWRLLPGMRQRGYGRIINVASLLGERTIRHVPSYCASKAGLIHLTHTLAVEWARHGISVNALAPGYIETDLNRDFLHGPAGQALISRIPVGRAGAPSDLDGALLLLAADAGAYITGAVIPVDGGHAVSPV